MKEWTTYSWGELISLEYGKPVADKAKSNGKHPVYGTNGQIGTSDLPPQCNHASTIIGRKGAYRGVHFSPVPFSVIDTAFYVEEKTCLTIPKWVYYKLSTLDINRMDSGSAIPSTDRYEVYSLPVHLPPIDVQRKAVSILSSLDDKIELNNRIIFNLEEQARAIFKQRYMSGEYYKRGVIGDILTLQRGYDLPRNRAETGIYPVAGSTETIFYHSQYTCEPPCIILGRSGNIGKPRLYLERCWAHNTSLFSKSFHDSNPLWCFYMLCEQNFAKVKGGSAVPTLNRNHVHMYEIEIAPLAEQNEFARIIEPMHYSIKHRIDENEKLSTLRDTLLPRLMSGEGDAVVMQR